jgi:hypothetical protein
MSEKHEPETILLLMKIAPRRSDTMTDWSAFRQTHQLEA